MPIVLRLTTFIVTYLGALGVCDYNKEMSGATIGKTEFKFPGQTRLHHGSVRDVYTINDKFLVMVASDRISAFDVLQPQLIPYKGQVLNQLASYFLKAVSSIVPTWFIDSPDPNVSIGYKCQPIRVEVVVRSVLVGHAWREYNKGKRQLCGVLLPDHLKEFDIFPEPIITPATKAETGHDEDISLAEVIDRNLATKKEVQEISSYAMQLFKSGQDMASKRGLILADTKYEFGKLRGKLYLIDEVHTPDSSRYFYAAGHHDYVNGKTKKRPKHLSKEFVREWLMAQGFSGQKGQPIPKMTAEFVQEVSERYQELFQQLTGRPFKPTDSRANPLQRIEKNVQQALKGLN